MLWQLRAPILGWGPRARAHGCDDDDDGCNDDDGDCDDDDDAPTTRVDTALGRRRREV